MKDDQTQNRFIELRADNWSFARIAKELGVSKQTLINWSKRYAADIANFRTVALEALQEKYHLTKAMRIQLLGQQLKRLTEELEKRDLSKLTTERLLDLVLKYLGEARSEVLEPLEFQGAEDVHDRLERMNVTRWEG